MIKKFISFLIIISIHIFVGLVNLCAEDELTLQECIELGLKNQGNYEIQLIKKRIPIAEGALRSSKGFYDPLLGVSVGKTHSEEAQVSTVFGTKTITSDANLNLRQNIFTGAKARISASGIKTDSNSIFTTINPSYSSSLSLDISQSLLKNFWGRQDKERVFLARQGMEITDLIVKEQIARFMVSIHQRYWNLVLAQKRLEIMKDSLARAERLLEHNKKRFGMGLVEKTDVLQLEAVVALRAVDVLKAQDAALDAEDTLKNAIYKDGVHNPESIVPVESFMAPEKEEMIGSIEDVQKTSLLKRWDINQARLDVENKEYSSKARKNERLPQLDVAGSLAYTGIGEKEKAAYDSAKSGNYPVWYGGVNLQVPIGNRDAAGKYASALHTYEYAELMLKKLERDILKETNAVYRRVKTSFKNIHASAKAEQLEKKKLMLEEEKFKQGRSSIKMVIDFQNDLQDAQLGALRSMIDYKLALVELDFTKGTLFEVLGLSP